MFESLVETIRSFSFNTVLKGNVMSSMNSFPGPGNNSSISANSGNSQSLNNRLLSNYYRRMQEIKDYEVSDLSSTTMSIYKDYIVGYFNTDTDTMITISDKVPRAKAYEAEINRIFNDLEVLSEVRDHLWDIIYDGAWCFKIAFDKETRTYRKFYLHNPHNVVTVLGGKGHRNHLVVSREGKIFEVTGESIFRIGPLNLTLINDVNDGYYRFTQEDSLVNYSTMMAGMPLYFNITNKVKEYLLRERILSLLSIKDLIQPLILLLNVDKNTAPDEANRLALNVETMINKYSDISQILGSSFSINMLIDSLMANIRVLPDYHSTMGNMNTVDLSKITSKIAEIENSQENKKDDIMTSNSIPRALYNGESTKWDAIKSSQRLNNKINGFITGITDSLRDEAINLCRYHFGVDLNQDDVTVNLFDKTEVDFNVVLTNIDIIAQMTGGIQQILDLAQRTMQENQLIDAKEYGMYVVDQLRLIDKEANRFINQGTIENFVNSMSQSNGMQQ